MPDEDDQDDLNELYANGPNALCFTCGGMRKISEPRLYVIQATEDMQAGMTMGEWKTCPHCKGKGYLPGINPPA